MNFDRDAFAHGPIESKIWLCQELAKRGLPEIDNVYVLGAWSGTMPFLLHALKPVEYQRMILVDINEEYLQQARVICNAIDCQGRLSVYNQDANTIQYSTDQINLVINTSTDNIDGFGWWRNIPQGTWTALQGRTGGHRDCVMPYDTVAEFDAAYPMSGANWADSQQFVYPDHRYTRFMKIGQK
jgi:hypothetical protein